MLSQTLFFTCISISVKIFITEVCVISQYKRVHPAIFP